MYRRAEHTVPTLRRDKEKLKMIVNYMNHCVFPEPSISVAGLAVVAVVGARRARRLPLALVAVGRGCVWLAVRWLRVRGGGSERAPPRPPRLALRARRAPCAPRARCGPATSSLLYLRCFKLSTLKGLTIG